MRMIKKDLQIFVLSFGRAKVPTLKNINEHSEPGHDSSAAND